MESVCLHKWRILLDNWSSPKLYDVENKLHILREYSLLKDKNICIWYKIVYFLQIYNCDICRGNQYIFIKFYLKTNYSIKF